ncbi:putative restriction endonuclease [Streptomyces sp. 846.5]|nr:Uma2 family endonuclease [Streptomyces sp. 846.5]TDT98662.1 putative restriction endonuclease [Streptomyces sp. 846.5]
MTTSVLERVNFPEGYAVLFGLDGKVIMVPRSIEHSRTIMSLQFDATAALGRHAVCFSDVYLDFPADETSAPDLAVIRQDARRAGTRYSFEDVLLIAEVVSTSSVRKDYDECTEKYGRYGIPICLIVDPYAREVVLHTAPHPTGYSQAPRREYGTGKLPIPLADGRVFTLDLDGLLTAIPES